MPDQTEPADATVHEVSPYESSWEHLADELRRLDFLLKLQVLTQWKSQPAGPLDQFKGLVVSEDEIAVLLKRIGEKKTVADASTETDSEIEQVRQALEELNTEIEQRRELSIEQGTHLSLHHLSEVFSLSPFEERCIVICLAPELNRQYEKLYAYLQDDVTRKKPGIDLILTLLTSTPEERIAARSTFQQRSPMFRYRLMQLIDGAPDARTPLLSRFLKLEDRIVDFLLGIQLIDSRLERAASIVIGASPLAEAVNEKTRNSVAGAIASHFVEDPSIRTTLAFYLHGPYGSGKQSIAELGASEMKLPLLIVDTPKMLEGPGSFEDLVWLAGREALLQPAVLFFDRIDAITGEGRDRSFPDLLLEVAKECSWVTFLGGLNQWRPSGAVENLGFIDVPLGPPADSDRVRVWQVLSSTYQLNSDVDLTQIAGRYNLTHGQIRDALAAAYSTARTRPAHQRRITMSDISAACRSQSGQKLASLARKITPVYSWNDIVLPAPVLSQLREMCERVVHRHRVMGDWGFGKKLALGKGVNALFAGPSGAGKTMAAEIIANELDLDLYKIDLSGVVSKYIGETEKNLDRVFSAAQDANAILFFDEADALFGKRSEVRDSHDRYANIEISYLLQKMEEYEGVAILATNLKANLDESFTRRLSFTVHFPFPDEASRQLIWKGIWPAAVTLDDGVDLSRLSRQFKLSGGNIKNVALGAAFLAAADGGSVTMEHLLRSTSREFQKLGKPLSEAELGARR